MKKALIILPAILVALLLVAVPKSAQATFDHPFPSFNPCQYVPQLCSPAPSVSPSPVASVLPSALPSWLPSILPSFEPSPSASASAEPSVEPSPTSGGQGLTDPGPGGTSGSDGHCTYDPNRSACGGKDPVVPNGAPATGFGPK